MVIALLLDRVTVFFLVFLEAVPFLLIAARAGFLATLTGALDLTGFDLGLVI